METAGFQEHFSVLQKVFSLGWISTVSELIRDGGTSWPTLNHSFTDNTVEFILPKPVKRNPPDSRYVTFQMLAWQRKTVRDAETRKSFTVVVSSAPEPSPSIQSLFCRLEHPQTLYHHWSGPVRFGRFLSPFTTLRWTFIWSKPKESVKSPSVVCRRGCELLFKERDGEFHWWTYFLVVVSFFWKCLDKEKKKKTQLFLSFFSPRGIVPALLPCGLLRVISLMSW